MTCIVGIAFDPAGLKAARAAIVGISGIYSIRHIASGREYVGSAVCIYRRWCSHVRLLERGKHHSRHLQRAWKQYGRQAFDLTLLELAAPTDLIEVEQRCLDSRRPTFNVLPTAASWLGNKHLPRSKHAMSVAKKGKALSPELREVKARQLREMRADPEVEARWLAANRAHSCGRVMSEETRKKLSAAKSGKKMPDGFGIGVAERNRSRKTSDSTRLLQSIARLGKPATAAHRAAVSAALKGHPVSEQTREKLRAKQLAAWARKKENSNG